MQDINCWNSKLRPCYYSDRLLDKINLSNKIVNKKVDNTEVRKAIYYAKKYHGDQKRQSGEPYYSHPLEVAYMLAEYTAEEAPQYYRTDLIVTSILHDVLEDTELTEDMISSIFGKLIACHVQDLTRIKPLGKISSAEIIDSLWNQKKYDLLLVKLLDRLHNIETIWIKPPDKIKKILEETLSRFLSLSIYLKIPKIEQSFAHLCILAANTHKDYSLLSKNNSQIPSLTLQSKIFRMHNL